MVRATALNPHQWTRLRLSGASEFRRFRFDSAQQLEVGLSHELDLYDFAPADIPLVEKLKSVLS
jgi:hypothetical protein